MRMLQVLEDMLRRLPLEGSLEIRITEEYFVATPASKPWSAQLIPGHRANDGNRLVIKLFGAQPRNDLCLVVLCSSAENISKCRASLQQADWERSAPASATPVQTPSDEVASTVRHQALSEEDIALLIDSLLMCRTLRHDNVLSALQDLGLPVHEHSVEQMGKDGYLTYDEQDHTYIVTTAGMELHAALLLGFASPAPAEPAAVVQPPAPMEPVVQQDYHQAELRVAASMTEPQVLFAEIQQARQAVSQAGEKVRTMESRKAERTLPTLQRMGKLQQELLATQAEISRLQATMTPQINELHDLAVQLEASVGEQAEDDGEVAWAKSELQAAEEALAQLRRRWTALCDS
jgi:NACalpha-BTF3-like transcription factor